MSEKQFPAQVVQLARLLGWRCYHTHDSRRSAAGFPDLVLVKGRRLLFVELKTDSGSCTRAQSEWLADLAGTGVGACVWRPRDWDVLQRVLEG